MKPSKTISLVLVVVGIVAVATNLPEGNDDKSKLPAADAGEVLAPPSEKASAALLQSNQDWPGLLGPTFNAAAAPLESPICFTSEGPKVLWRSDIGSGYSAPIAKGRLVIVQHRLNDTEIVEAFDIQSGDSVWQLGYPTDYECRFEYSNGPYSTPVMDDELVFALSAEGTLRCVTVASGDLIWARDLVHEYSLEEGEFPFSTSPCIYDQTLVLNVGGENAGIVAFDRATGSTIWTSTNEQRAYTTPVVAKVFDRDRLFVLGYDNLLCIDPKSGNVFWQEEFHARNRDLGKLNATSPLVVDNRVFVAAFGLGIMCVELTEHDGHHVKWKHNARRLSNQMSPLVESDGGVIGFSTTNRTFRCVDSSSGEEMWAWRSKLGREPQYLKVGKQILMLGEDGRMATFELTKNQLQISGLTENPLVQGPCFCTPTLAQERIFVRNEEELVCFATRG